MSTSLDLTQAPQVAPQDRRWSWVQVDLDAIRYNMQTAKRLAGDRHVLAVVKADAYGHGAVEVARAVLGNGADYLGVATVDEGVALREAGINAPIMILSQPPASAVPLLLYYKIMPAVYTMEFALHYAEVADANGLMAPFHLAVNTGMNRIGVRWDQVAEFMEALSFHRAVNLVGVFTHFATADETQSIDYHIQVNRFNQAIQGLREAGINPGIIHCANTAATLRFPDVHCDMVRFGIGLYGLHPCDDTRRLIELRPAMSIHARITNVNTPVLGDGVSYGLHYRCDGNTRICTIPVGYADGLPRVLSGCIDIIWNGRRCHQVGNICMDQCMFEVEVDEDETVDFAPGYRSPSFNFSQGKAGGTYGIGGPTEAPVSPQEPQIGDEVLLVGYQGGSLVTLDELADKAGTIHYELACDFGLRMPKLYV